MKPLFFAFAGFSDALLEQLSSGVAGALEGIEWRGFSVGCSFPYSVSEDEKALLKKEFQFALVKQLEQKLGKPADFENPEVVLTIDFNARKVVFEIRSVFVEGRYNKYSREIAQTIFYCPKCKGKGCVNCGQKGVLGLETVEELCGKPAMRLLEGSGFAFHGAGREDVDVQMLGNGRRFVLEIKEPKKRSVSLKAIEDAINSDADGKIKVRLLDFVSRKRVAVVKEERHFKKYWVLVQCGKAFSEKEIRSLTGKEIIVQQQTPNRVLKRRSDLVRERKATILSLEVKSEKAFEMVLLAEAGLYVKEFVSSDSGRTKPNLGELIDNDCACKQLDVLEIVETETDSG